MEEEEEKETDEQCGGYEVGGGLRWRQRRWERRTVRRCEAGPGNQRRRMWVMKVK